MYLWCCSEDLWKSSAVADIQSRWTIFPQNIGRLIQLTPPIHFTWDNVYQIFFQSNSVIEHRVGENRILSVIYCVTLKDNAIFYCLLWFKLFYLKCLFQEISLRKSTFAQKAISQNPTLKVKLYCCF